MTRFAVPRLALTVLLCAAPGYAQVPVSVNSFGRGDYHSAEGRYTAYLPAAPTAKRVTARDKNGNPITQHQAVAKEGDAEYTVGYFDIPAGGTYRLTEAPDTALSALLRMGARVKLLREEELRYGNAAGEFKGVEVEAEAEINGAQRHIHAKVYHAPGRVYFIIADLPSPVSTHYSADRYLFVSKLRIHAR